jgi:hypothetical protein
LPDEQDQWNTRRAEAYRKLFLKNGKLTPDAKIVLKDLYMFTKFYQDVPLDSRDAMVGLAAVEGARKVLRHIINITEQSQREPLRVAEEEIFHD